MDEGTTVESIGHQITTMLVENLPTEYRDDIKFASPAATFRFAEDDFVEISGRGGNPAGNFNNEDIARNPPAILPLFRSS